MTQTYIYICSTNICIYIYINKSFKQIAKISQTRAQSWSNLPTSRPFYSRHANASGSWSLDFLDSNRQAKSSAEVRDLKIVRPTKYRPTLECQGKIADVQNRKAVKGWLGQLLAQIMSWGRIIKLLHSIAVFNFSNAKTILVHFPVPERNMLIA